MTHDTHPAIHWLHETRKISMETITRCLEAGWIHTDTRQGKPAIAAIYRPIDGDPQTPQAIQYLGADLPQKPNKSGTHPSKDVYWFGGGDPSLGDPMIIVEGVIDAMTVMDIMPGYVGVALGRTSYFRNCKHLQQHRDQIIICMDNDEPGHKATAKIIEALGGSVRVVQWSDSDPQGCDLNDQLQAGRADRIPELIQGAIEMTTGPGSIWDSPADVQSMIHTPPPPMRWFVEGNIPAGRGIIITGLGGSSKTRLLYQLAMGAAVGDLPWKWEIGVQGKSVLVLTEDTQDDVHRTLHALCTSITLDPDQLQQIYNSIIVYPLAGTDVRLLNFGRDRELKKTDLFYSLESKIKSIGNVAFVGLDPALSLTAGDEQDQGHQRALGKMTDDLAVRSGATVALVTHATKASLAQDELTSHASRGGGGVTDAVRAEFAMRTMTAAEARKAGIADMEERKRHVQLVGTKGNLLPPAAYVPVWLRRDDYGTLINADVSLTHQPNDPSSEDFQALDILKDMSLKHTPSLADWRQSCLDGGLFQKSKTSEAQTKAMQRTIKRLNQAGLIQKGIGRGIWLPTEPLRTSEMDSFKGQDTP